MFDLEAHIPPGFTRKGPHEWAGPCPRCGGRDRFIIWPEGTGRGIVFMCRQCAGEGGREHWTGDALAYFREVLGWPYAEARKAAGLGDAPAPPSPCREKEPGRPQAMPLPRWSATAALLLERFGLEPGREMSREARAALDKRSLKPEAAARLGLFWIGRRRYGDRAAWGLPPRDDGGLKLALPAGLGYPIRRGGRIVGLTIRNADYGRERPEAGPKYWEVAGGARGLPLMLGEAGRPAFVFESAYDAMLLWQECGDMAAAVALQGAGKGLDPEARAFLGKAPLVVFVADVDANEAGRKAWERFKGQWPEAHAWAATAGKDLGEQELARRKGAKVPTVREWAEWALLEAKAKGMPAMPEPSPLQGEKAPDAASEPRRETKPAWDRQTFIAGLLRPVDELAARRGMDAVSFLEACRRLELSPLDYRAYGTNDLKRDLARLAC